MVKTAGFEISSQRESAQFEKKYQIQSKTQSSLLPHRHVKRFLFCVSLLSSHKRQGSSLAMSAWISNSASDSHRNLVFKTCNLLRFFNGSSKGNIKKWFVLQENDTYMHSGENVINIKIINLKETQSQIQQTVDSDLRMLIISKIWNCHTSKEAHGSTQSVLNDYHGSKEEEQYCVKFEVKDCIVTASFLLKISNETAHRQNCQHQKKFDEVGSHQVIACIY